jgi:multiple sugar transport system permease protein
MILMFAIPLLNSCIMAFENYKLGYPDIYFNGLDNFRKLFSDRDLGMIVQNTLVYVIITVLCQFLLGFMLALALWKHFPGRGIYQSIVFLPWAFSAFVVGLMFRWSFNGEYGVVNDLLLKLGAIADRISWLGSPGFSLAVVILAMIWIGYPFFAMMILAALQSIPADLFEAAAIDGANIFVRFFRITVPYIRPTLVMTVLLRTIWILNSIDMIVVITDGGPANHSMTLPAYMYTRAFSGYDFGLASAIGLLLMGVLTVYTLIYIRVTGFSAKGEV